MRVGIIQSNYIPWRGYFDFIADCDVFVFLDDVQYTRRDWRNRNKIKTAAGTEWLTVPVVHTNRDTTRICDVKIHGRDYIGDHIAAFERHYRDAPYRGYAANFLRWIPETDSLSEVNQSLVKGILRAFGINTMLLDSRDFGLDPSLRKSARLLAILQSLGATRYLSGPAAKDYLDMELFQEAGIAVEWKEYRYDPYPQLHGAFRPDVTVLDLIANVGPGRARQFLKSKVD